MNSELPKPASQDMSAFNIAAAYDLEDAKMKILQETDIVDLVGSYVRLVPCRREEDDYDRWFHGACPFHDELRPGIEVDAFRQSFHCHFCDISGGVFGFVMKAEGIGFREAVELLTARIKLQTPVDKLLQKLV